MKHKKCLKKAKARAKAIKRYVEYYPDATPFAFKCLATGFNMGWDAHRKKVNSVSKETDMTVKVVELDSK